MRTQWFSTPRRRQVVLCLAVMVGCTTSCFALELIDVAGRINTNIPVQHRYNQSIVVTTRGGESRLTPTEHVERPTRSYTNYWQNTMDDLTDTVAQLCSAVMSFLSFYFGLLVRFPLLTKSMTSGIIGGAGDLLAQTVERNLQRSTKGLAEPISLRRSLCVAAEGLFVSGPLMHYTYDLMDYWIPVEAATGSLQKWALSLLQVLLDCVVMDALFVATLMVTTAILEGKAKRIPRELRTEYLDGVKAAWASSLCFAPMQCALFRYVPISLRVLAMNVQDIVWNASVSYVAHRNRWPARTPAGKEL